MLSRIVRQETQSNKLVEQQGDYLKPYVGLIIQARLGGSRFPGKVLQTIGGRTILETVVARCHEAKLVDKVVIAMPENPMCCLNEEIFIGSEDNVLDRYYQCAKHFNFDVIVRITCDCPLTMPFEIDRCVEAFLSNKVDYVTNRPAMPDGFDVEVFSYQALEKVWTDNKFDEHVTTHIKTMNSLVLDAPKLSVDEPADLERVKQWIGQIKTF